MNPYNLLTQLNHDANPDYYRHKYIFEAGFNDLENAIKFYLKYNFKKFQGVDIEPECATIINKELVPVQSYYETYTELCSSNCINTPMEKNEFNVVFNLNNNTNIQDFIESNPNVIEKFDIGVFTRLFHLLNDKEIPKQIVKWFYNNSTEKALMLFNVSTNNINPYTGEEVYNILTHNSYEISELIELFNGVQVVRSNEDSFELILIEKRCIT
ncbi:MAG: hypothetical protein IPG55_16400 [Saprospiraceae bacterium]|nr:hypothetical protein [Candidatus Defluviibacterium haderslevense]